MNSVLLCTIINCKRGQWGRRFRVNFPSIIFSSGVYLLRSGTDGTEKDETRAAKGCHHPLCHGEHLSWLAGWLAQLLGTNLIEGEREREGKLTLSGLESPHNLGRFFKLNLREPKCFASKTHDLWQNPRDWGTQLTKRCRQSYDYDHKLYIERVAKFIASWTNMCLDQGRCFCHAFLWKWMSIGKHCVIARLMFNLIKRVDDFAMLSYGRACP